ncbi:MAG: carbon-nitrogen hydrolase family protein [Desulfobacter sp.]|nr:MAG: carbon-nitrogen hydrolase family protein [Desulfobacter sp.]
MAENFKLAVAQVPSVKGDVSANIQTHLGAVGKAAQIGVSYIVFPELSLTGYEPELAENLAFSKKDPRLTPLIDAAKNHKIHIVAGAPLQAEGRPRIGEFIFSPHGGTETYAKMNLHPGEEQYFSVGGEYHSVNTGGQKIFNAICADTNNTRHAQICAQMGATVYIAGVLISASGYDADTQKLAAYSKAHGCLVAMANHNQPTGGWVPVGKSAIWDASRLIAVADETRSELVVATFTPHGWKGEVAAL